MSGFRYEQGATQVSLDGDSTLDLRGNLKVAGSPIGSSVSFSIAPAGANVSEVTITVKDGAGVAVAKVHHLDLWLSDAATGAGLTGTTASGTVTAKAASGVVIQTNTAKKALRVQTLATGVFVLEITDTAKTGFYVAATVPLTGAAVVSSQLVTGSYG
jgi:hypothetical protein